MCYSALIKRDVDGLGRRFVAIAVRTQIDEYAVRSSTDPKRFPPLDDRIFPGHYAPVIFERDGARVIEVMRYGAYPPENIFNPKKYTSFNARRDNLTSSFWSNAFLRHHGFIVLQGFYEWVAVKDLLKAGVVTLDDVKAEFARQSEERKAKILVQGKKYKPTPTELKDPLDRQIIIEFKPTADADLLVPVIFSEKKLDSGEVDKGFAIVTDEPLPDILEAGHDRSPVILNEESIAAWIGVGSGSRAAAMDAILASATLPTFHHKLDTAS